jgi:hypothetical protein
MRNNVIVTILAFGLLSGAASAQIGVGGKPATVQSSSKVLEKTKELSDSGASQEEIVKKLYAESDKKDKMNLLSAYETLESAAKILEKNYNEEFLVKVLGFYPNYLKVDNTHYHLEMFADLYKSKKAEFDKAIDKALSKADAEEFRRRMGFCLSEAENGNG